MKDYKFCLTCGNKYYRKLYKNNYGNLIPLTISLWSKRKYCSLKCSPTVPSKKSEHTNWKGDQVGYHGLHQWIRHNFGRPTECADCGKDNTQSKRSVVHWASIKHLYLRDKDNWIALCAKCHYAFDKLSGVRG